MKNLKIILIIILTINSNYFLIAQNLINNPSVEDPSNEATPLFYGLVNDISNFNLGIPLSGLQNGLSYWQSDMKIKHKDDKSYYLHSPDWYMNNTYDGQYPNLPKLRIHEGDSYIQAHSGYGYVGMATGELIQQKLTNSQFVEGESYTLNFYIRPNTSTILGGNWANGLDLKVYLRKSSMNYSISANNIDNRCNWDEYYEKSSTNINTITVLNQHIDLSSYPIGQWYPITVTFNAPPSSYDWIAFETQTNDDPCSGYYLLLDDFSLTKTCEVPSCDRLSGEVFPMHNGLINSTTPLTITNLENANNVLIEIFTQLGQSPIWSYYINCTNGINEPIYWDGKNNYGGNAANTAYFIKFTSTNNCGTKEKVSLFAKNQNYNSSITNNIICNTSGVKTPIPCCIYEPNIIVDNITLPGLGLLDYKVINKIDVAPYTYVTVTNNADVEMKAGNEIILNPGFKVNLGGVYLAEIIPCHKSGKLRSSDIDPLEFEYSDEEEDEEVRKSFSKISEGALNKNVKIDIYPNPTDSKLNISFENMSNGHYELYSLDGRLILSKEFKNTNEINIDLSNNESGVYFLKLKINGELISKKIIKE